MDKKFGGIFIYFLDKVLVLGGGASDINSLPRLVFDNIKEKTYWCHGGQEQRIFSPWYLFIICQPFLKTKEKNYWPYILILKMKINWTFTNMLNMELFA